MLTYPFEKSSLDEQDAQDAPETEPLLPATSTTASDESDPEARFSAAELALQPPVQAGDGTPYVDPRFVQKTPSAWKRAALLVLVCALFWLTFRLRPAPHGRHWRGHGNAHGHGHKHGPGHPHWPGHPHRPGHEHEHEHGGKHIEYADRYSKDFKFRPAASPIFAETLADGTVVVHGAEPEIHLEMKPHIQMTQDSKAEKGEDGKEGGEGLRA